MREIKFRLYDPEEGMCQIKFMNLEKHNQGPDSFHVMQFTGFRNRNGAEVWEGDICKITSCMDEELVGEVVWNDDRLCWALDVGNDLVNISDILHCEHWIDVIGNIYENSDLLEEVE